MRTWAIARVGILVVGAGCYHASFEQHVPCSEDLHCPGDQVCDTSQSPPTCVGQAGDPGDGGAGSPDGPTETACGECANPNPVCDSDSKQCRGCSQDHECASGVCSESTGVCIAEANALYVKRNGDDSGTCTHTDPCGTISRAVALLDGTRSAIKVYDGNYNDAFATEASFLLSGENDGDNATINFKPNGKTHTMELDGGHVVVEDLILDGGQQEPVRIQDGANVSLFQVEIRDSPVGSVEVVGATVLLDQSEIHDGHGGAPGVNVVAGDLTMDRTVMYSIGGACVKVSGRYTIQNSFLVTCGDEGFVQDGLLVSGSLFQFNTLASNGAGATCDTPAVLTNTIFADNGTASPQLGGACTATYSLFTDTAPPGTGNISNGNPAFVSGDDDHITMQSGARDKGDPGATLTYDFDGEPRPHGANYDIGADEHY